MTPHLARHPLGSGGLFYRRRLIGFRWPREHESRACVRGGFRLPFFAASLRNSSWWATMAGPPARLPTDTTDLDRMSRSSAMRRANISTGSNSTQEQFNSQGSGGSLEEWRRHEWRNDGLSRLNGRLLSATVFKISFGKGAANLEKQVHHDRVGRSELVYK